MENFTISDQPEVIQRALTFSWIDYTLFFSMFGVSTLIGVYFGYFSNKQATISEYLLGSRAMSVFPIAVSLTASHLSGITLLGMPSEIYLHGTQFSMCIFSALLVSVIMVYVYLPVFYTLKVSSSYEYLNMRFDSSIRTAALAIYIIGSLLHIAIVIYVPALAFNHVSGTSIHKITPIICGICIFYTTIGGLKGVVWSDTVQFIVTLVSMCTVLVMGIVSAGGVQTIWKIAEQGDRIEFFNMDPDPTARTTFWTMIIGLTTSWVTSFGVNPSSVQRFMAVPSLEKAKMCVIIFGIGVFITKSISCFSGLVMYAKYKDCDPYTSCQIKRPDQLLPYYILDVARNIPGLPGLFVAGVFSAALSTMSTNLNTMAGIIYEDFLRNFMPKSSTEKTAGIIIKSTVVLTGIICVVLVFVVEHLGGVIQISNAFAGITNGPLLGLFTLGMLFPSVTTKGALYGSVVALLSMGYIAAKFQYNVMKKVVRYSHKPLSTLFCDKLNLTSATEFTCRNSTAHGTPQEEPFFLFRMSFYWYAPLGCIISILTGLLVTRLSGEKNELKYKKELYSPIIHKFIEGEKLNYKTVEQTLDLVKR